VHGSWQGGYAGTDSCVTDSAGQCRVQTGHIKNRYKSSTFTISDISHASHEYRPVDNHDANGDSDGATLTVKR
jgi:hypothetical protein